ncbi:hypothetical protein PTTG_05371, partial [Puccinia triticina 1-1 BBBD Race 1]
MFSLPDRVSHPYSLRPRASSVTTRTACPSINPLGFDHNLLNHHPLGQPFPGDADATPVEQAAHASSGRMKWTQERRDYLTQSLVMSDICSDSPEALREIIVGNATMDTLKRVANSGQDVPAPSSNERVLHPSPSSEVDRLVIPPGLVGLHPQYQTPKPYPAISTDTTASMWESPTYQPGTPSRCSSADCPVYQAQVSDSPAVPDFSSNRIVFDDSWTQLPGWMSKPTAPHKSEPDNHQPIQVDDQPDLPQSSKEAAPT